MTIKKLTVPDIGDYKDVRIIEVHVNVKDEIKEEDSLITLETDKASMEIPSPYSGTVTHMHVKVGDKVSKDSLVLSLEISEEGNGFSENSTNSSNQKTLNNSSLMEDKKSLSERKEQADNSTVFVPDIGDYKDVRIIEIHVGVDDEIKEEDSLITLETDKASMEIPSPYSGCVSELFIKTGDRVSKGDQILSIKIDDTKKLKEDDDNLSSSSSKEQLVSEITSVKEEDTYKKNFSIDEKKIKETETNHLVNERNLSNSAIYASPSIRRLARILNIDLVKLTGTGRKGRITKDDCYSYIKKVMTEMKDSGYQQNSQLGLLPDPDIDFSKFGEIQSEPLSRINKLSSQYLARNWVRIPHVTFYDKANITDLNSFIRLKKNSLKNSGIKITLLSFLIKASSIVLKEFPRFNSSLSKDGEKLIIKKYYNIGFAVDTKFGLVVPSIKNVDQKSILSISSEITSLVDKCHNNKVSSQDIQGATFTISSLGSLGSTGFTPIINMPEVAIFGVSKAKLTPVWNDEKRSFLPEMMLPLSLSIDHRVIDGALAAKFLTRYCEIVSDLREMLL